MMILIAFAAMLAATLIQHLGLAEAVSAVVGKVTACNQCFTFWSTLAALVYFGCDAVVAAMLAIGMSYLSNWVVLLLVSLQRLFSHIYENQERTEREGK